MSALAAAAAGLLLVWWCQCWSASAAAAVRATPPAATARMAAAIRAHTRAAFAADNTIYLQAEEQGHRGGPVAVRGAAADGQLEPGQRCRAQEGCHRGSGAAVLGGPPVGPVLRVW